MQIPRAWSLLVFSCVACGVPPRPASNRAALGSAALVIAAVAPGGGNDGAVYDRDFVVIVNRGSFEASLAGLSLQYASGSGTSALGATEATRATLPDRVLAPGGAILIAGAVGAGHGAALPFVDVADETPIALATSAGRLALVTGVEPLGCNGASMPCDDAMRARVVDLVGWGSAAWSEGAPAASPTNAASVVRLGDGCVDTDANADDFAEVAAHARSSIDPARPCVGPADAGPDARVDADGGVVDPIRPDASVPPSEPTWRAPSDVQGEGYVSPWVGRVVSSVRGVVTWSEPARFALEDETSTAGASAVFVSTRDRGVVPVGSLVAVDGVVREVVPYCDSCDDVDSLHATTIVADHILDLGTAAIPDAHVITRGSFPDAFGPHEASVDLETRSTLDPSQALDELERLEARRVRLVMPQALGPTRSREDRGRSLFVGFESLREQDRSRFGPSFELVDAHGLPLPWLDAGDTFVADVVALVDTDGEAPVLRPLAVTSTQRPVEAEPSLPSVADGAVRAATFNVHGLSAVDSGVRFRDVGCLVAVDLGAPDVLALEEVEDDSGNANDGVTSARETLARLVDAISVCGGPTYRAIDREPIDGEDGGAPGANIRVALLVRIDRGIDVVERETTTGTTLPPSPSRLGEGDAVFDGGRKPLLVELDVRGARWLVAVVHLRSHLGDSPRLGRLQPAPRPSDDIRRREASAVAAELERLAARRDVELLVLGDFNDPSESDALAPFVGRGLVPVPFASEQDAASYFFGGFARSFDHAYASPSLASRAVARTLHIAAGKATSISDHDPVVLDIAKAGSIAPAGCATTGAPRERPVVLPFAWLVATAMRLRRSRRCP